MNAISPLDQLNAFDLSASAQAADSGHFSAVWEIAKRLSAAGLYRDAATLLEHLLVLRGGDADLLLDLLQVRSRDGQTLKALDALTALRGVCSDPVVLAQALQTVAPVAVAKFNLLLAKGDVESASAFASALADLLPRNVAIVEVAFSCCVELGQMEAAERYACWLLMVQPGHAAALAFARRVTAEKYAGSVDQKVEQALDHAGDVHPLIRLRDLYDAASDILCGELTRPRAEQVRRLVDARHSVQVDAPDGSDLADWEKHYRLGLKAVEVSCLLDDAGLLPELSTRSENDAAVDCFSSTGGALQWADLKQEAERVGARAVFFAAADQKYVELYARWYVKSILKHTDTPCLVVLHVIGGAGRLAEIAGLVGVSDARFVLTADEGVPVDACAKNYDAPPKGLIDAPVAYFQSVRFLRLGALLRNLGLPVFVSDIDLLLQRGVQDLLDRCVSADIVFNENESNRNAGSRLTANLLLVKPRPAAMGFLAFLSDYLEQALSAPEVSRWIDQYGLLMARHYMVRKFGSDGIQYFDTTSDINNIMYRSYQDNPFRFLSLYHGFDTSSLERE